MLLNLESQEELKNLPELLSACDGVIICRQWLQNTGGEPYTPQLQQKIIADCKNSGKLVFVKGQVFESLSKEDKPNYSEILDLQNIVSMTDF